MQEYAANHPVLLAAADVTEAKIRRTQTSMLYDQLPQGLAATVFNSTLMAWALSAVIPATPLILWMSIMVSLCVYRYVTLKRFRREDVDAFDDTKWRKIFKVSATATAIAWGAAGFLLFPDSSTQHQALIGFVLAGMAAGASSSMAADDRIYRIYLFIVIVPYLTQLLLEGSTVNVAMAAMGGAFLAAMSISSRKTARVTHDALRLKFENQHLLTELSQQAEQLRVANELLTGENAERQKSESALREALDDVKTSARAKSQFLANMSHEIRTPMNGVFGMTDLLMRTKLDDRQKKLLGTINESAKSLLTIINDILDLSRIESGKLELDIHEFSTRDIIERATELLASQSHKKGLELSVFVDKDVPFSTKGDSGRIKQVLLNILGNALKFTQYGEIAVRVTRAGGSDTSSRIRFEVRDTGIGIDAAVLDKLFDPFTQAESSISRRFGGTGLGLSISRHLVELMGGKIELKSTLGKGTQVAFELDLEHGLTIQSAADNDPGVLEGARIIVVDDRETNCEILANYLSTYGSKVSVALSTAQAWPMLEEALAAGKPFHAAVIDMLMPDENGLEFSARIKDDAKLSRLKVIMATSLNWQGDLASIRNAGIETLLTKPIRRHDLISAASRAISGNRHPGWRPKRPQNAAAELGSDKITAIATFDARVLLVEDNPVNIEVAVELLTSMGCMVQTARNGLEALAQFKNETFDIVLMDCQMPIMDGLSATRRIREFELVQAKVRIPIVALTANAYAEDRARCIDAGMDDYLSKPYAEEQLSDTLKKWLKLEASTSAASEPEPAVSHSSPISVDTAPATPKDDAPQSVIDEGVVGPLRKSRPDLFKRLTATYLNYAPTALAELKTALEAKDLTTLGRVAHSLKSSSANLGATKLSKFCKDLELATKENNEAAVEGLVAGIVSAFADVAAALTAGMPDEAPSTAPVRVAK
jgi:two-component system, sensor histidine kinase and response regulator